MRLLFRAGTLLGFQELARVVKPGGAIRLLEHVRPRQSLLAFLMDALSPVHARLRGSYLNRRTVETVAQSGLLLERVEALDGLGILNLLVARTPPATVSRVSDWAPAEELLREVA